MSPWLYPYVAEPSLSPILSKNECNFFSFICSKTVASKITNSLSKLLLGSAYLTLYTAFHIFSLIQNIFFVILFTSWHFVYVYKNLPKKWTTAKEINYLKLGKKQMNN